MSQRSRNAFQVSVVIATVVISIQNFIIKYYDILNSIIPEGGARNAIKLLLYAGISVIFYQFLNWLYINHLWKLFRPESCLEGKWEHKITPRDPNPNDDRVGTFEIKQTAFDTRIVSGKNADLNGIHFSHWKSLAVYDEDIHDRQMLFVYEINRDTDGSGESPIDRGIINVQLEPNKTTNTIEAMSGHYWDAGQSSHRGLFQATRKKD